MYKFNVKDVTIDISENTTQSNAVNTDGMLLTGIVFPAAMTGTAVTFDFSVDGTTSMMLLKQMAQRFLIQ